MIDALILSTIQALTEFLPVSSTAHLIVFSHVFEISTLGRLTEVVLHLGTLGVVMIYFRRDLQEGVEGLGSLVKGQITAGLHRWLHIACATIPVVIVGYIVHKYFGNEFRSFQIMGWSSIIFGVLLFFVDKKSLAQKTIEAMTYKESFIIGLFQVIALIPGASRLGTTLITARFLGYDRPSAARFSFLLSLPVVVGAAVLLVLSNDASEGGQSTVELLSMLLLLFALGYGVLTSFMTWLKRHTLVPFAVYRIVFGAYVLWAASV